MTLQFTRFHHPPQSLGDGQWGRKNRGTQVSPVAQDLPENEAQDGNHQRKEKPVERGTAGVVSRKGHGLLFNDRGARSRTAWPPAGSYSGAVWPGAASLSAR